MQRLVSLIFFIVALTLNSQGVHAAANYNNGNKDCLTHTSITDQTTPVAIFTNGNNSFRFGSSRPQRVIPGQSPKNNSVQGYVPFSSIRNNTQRNYYRGKLARSSSPFRPEVSCLYYVIALRHIIR